MGQIDVDPASCAMANEIVKAGKYYTIDDNGLAQDWFGRVWLNPPYSFTERDAFVRMLLAKQFSGETIEACLLLNNTTEVSIEQEALGRCDAVCFIRARLAFYNETQSKGKGMFGQMVIYYGRNVRKFSEVFGELGIVMVPL